MIGSAGALRDAGRSDIRSTVTFTFPGKRTASNRLGIGLKDIAPRFAFAWSPSTTAGISQIVWRSCKTSIRVGMVFTMTIRQGITNSFDRNGSFGLSTIFRIRRHTGRGYISTLTDLFTIRPTASKFTSDCPVAPCSIINPHQRELSGNAATTAFSINGGSTTDQDPLFTRVDSYHT